MTNKVSSLFQEPFDPSTRKPENFETPALTQVERARLKLFPAQGIITEPYVKGFDISQWNTIDVDGFKKAYAAGYRFAFIKATEGYSYLDPKFNTLWPQLVDAGFLVAPYHFFRSNVPAANQADFHLNIIAKLLAQAKGRVLPSMIDEETNDGVTVAVRVARLFAFAAACKTVANPWMYSSPALWQSLTGGVSLGGCMGVVAHWADRSYPALPNGWMKDLVRAWQIGIYPTYPWVPPVPGILKSVDVDYFFGTEEDLQKLVIGGFAPPEDDMDKEKVLAELAKIQAANDAIDVSVGLIQDELGDPDPEPTPTPPPPVPPSPPPVPKNVVKFKVVPYAGRAQANARFVISRHTNGVPVFAVWPKDTAQPEDKQQFKKGEILQVYVPPETGDGGTKCFKIYDPDKKLKFNPLYIRQLDGVKQV